MYSRLLEVLDKGKAAAVTTIVETIDAATGKPVFENQSTVFIRGSGGFGGKRNGSGELLFTRLIFLRMLIAKIPPHASLLIDKDRGPATAPNTPPKRAPDAVVEEQTSPSQAALYRYIASSLPFPRTSLTSRTLLLLD